MPQIGPLEILVVGIVALIVFGPQKLPEMARSVGRALNELKRMASEVRSEFEMGLDDVEDEPDDPPPTRARRAEPDTAEPDTAEPVQKSVSEEQARDSEEQAPASDEQTRASEDPG